MKENFNNMVIYERTLNQVLEKGSLQMNALKECLVYHHLNKKVLTFKFLSI